MWFLGNHRVPLTHTWHFLARKERDANSSVSEGVVLPGKLENRLAEEVTSKVMGNPVGSSD